MRALMVLPLVFAVAPVCAHDDGPIRRAEVAPAVERQFAQIDVHHKGVVTRSDFDRFHASAAGQAADASTDLFGHIGSHWFEHADHKKAGQVTLQMAQHRALKLFDRADSDHDGVLSPSELKAARELRREKL